VFAVDADLCLFIEADMNMLRVDSACLCYYIDMDLSLSFRAAGERNCTSAY